MLEAGVACHIADMEQRDLERVRAAYATYDQGGDLDPALFDPDVEWHNAPELPGATVHRGFDAMMADLRAQEEAWDERRLVPVDIVAAGDRAVVSLEVHARGRSSGVPVRLEVFHVLTVREGKVARVQAFVDRDQALREAGLERH
jgi:uncharacterized protein